MEFGNQGLTSPQLFRQDFGKQDFEEISQRERSYAARNDGSTRPRVAAVSICSFRPPRNTAKVPIMSCNTSSPHPLLPLTASEIAAVAKCVLSCSVSASNGTTNGTSGDSDGSSSPSLRFVAISLLEPSTTELQSYEEAPASSKPPLPRQAEVVTLNSKTGLAAEHIVELYKDDKSLTAKRISFVELPPGTQPMFTPDDCDLAEQIVLKSSWVQKVVHERYGISPEDFASRLVCDPWSVHLAGSDDHALVQKGTEQNGGVPARLVQTFLYHRQAGKGMEDNHYAHPVSRELRLLMGFDRTYTC